MGILKLPRVRLYWSRMFRVDLVAQAMPRNRFFELRSYVHFVDKLSITPNEREENRLVLVKPILTSFRNACLELPRSRDVSIDEQMIPFSGRCPVRQCVPSKPNPVGLKNFVMASPDGLVLDFAIYVGKGTVSVEDMREFGLGGSIIKKLVATLKRDQHTFLFTDRYFTDMKIAEHLVDENIFLTGTVMANRTGGVAAAMPQDRDMKRGDSHCKVRSDRKMCLVKWKDNKSVLVLSTGSFLLVQRQMQRWSKDKKKKVKVPQPHAVAEYNQFMGGVDLIDRFVSYYRISMRTKKWTVRVFAQFLDIACCNGWIEYKRLCEQSATPKQQRLDLLTFKMDIAIALIKAETSPRSKRLRETEADSDDEEVNARGKKRGKVTALPPDDVRYDLTGHFPEHQMLGSHNRCRNPGCSGKSRVKCLKCGIFLCLQNRNCFLKFHTR
ncbi:piggyBac transposable element-derived protein 3 [Dermacentor silvarum]|uniref:piggyBac transposable element-derived protein 3 n=1 Tax=Dermacentor silvarum TaxID=543639 RepID=UPI002101CCE5|nr:piggyBac transposable element-derived protein 3 [Dermacentor silvarum]